MQGHALKSALYRMALLLAHQQSAHGFLPSSRSLQRFGPHFYAITPVVSLWGRQHESSLQFKQAQIQRAVYSGGKCFVLGLTVSSTRTQPARAGFMSHGCDFSSSL